MNKDVQLSQSKDPGAHLNQMEHPAAHLLCRTNARSRFGWLAGNSDFFHLYVGEDLPPKGMPPGVSIWLDHERRSLCREGPRGPCAPGCLLISDSTSGGPGVFQWPNGLESKMVLDRPSDTKTLIHGMRLAAGQPPGKRSGVADTVTGGPYQKPASGGRDDRTPLRKAQRARGIPDPKRTGFGEYLKKLESSAFSLCPEGNGLDSHRLYESYALGATPVVRRGALMKMHAEFSPVVVEDWDEIENLPIQGGHAPDPEKLTIGYWMHKALRGRCEIVQFFTSGLIEQWRNFMATARKVGVADRVVVYPMDEESKAACISDGVETRDLLLDRSHVAESSFMDSAWWGIMANKLRAVTDALRRGGIVLYLDTDIVLLRDPLHDLLKKEPADVRYQPEEGPGEACAGCLLFYPTRGALKLVEEWQAALPDHPCDQSAFNHVLGEDMRGSVRALPMSGTDYLNGLRHWGPVAGTKELQGGETAATRRMEKAVLIHNNFIMGVKAKNERFREAGLWYV